MHVGRIMKTELITVEPDTPVSKAKRLIEEKKISHLLVVNKKGKFQGIVSDRDVKQSWASPATALSVHELNYLLDQLKVEHIMTKTPLTVSPGTTIERAAHLMQQNRISALPVIKGEDLVGIITRTDVMGLLLQAIGIDKDSARFTVLVKDRVGVMADISQMLKDAHVNIRSLVTWPETAHPGYYQLVLRVPAENGRKAVETLEKGGFKVLTDYVEDFTPYL
jgi:acetoin utilization protein AcuB